MSRWLARSGVSGTALTFGPTSPPRWNTGHDRTGVHPAAAASAPRLDPRRGSRGDHVARAWFLGGNPVLGETTPLTAIRTDRGEELMLAVKVLVEDTPDT